jgi:hypothetical protein
MSNLVLHTLFEYRLQFMASLYGIIVHLDFDYDKKEHNTYDNITISYDRNIGCQPLTIFYFYSPL